MEWKILIMLCLLIFAATTIVIDLATMAFSTFSFNAPLRLTSLSNDFIEPLGDPVDIDEFPS